jgi:hypothetical protein
VLRKDWVFGTITIQVLDAEHAVIVGNLDFVSVDRRRVKIGDLPVNPDEYVANLSSRR